MARQVNQVLWDQWRRRIEAQCHSGLSIAAFCRRENCSRQGFHLWRRKLGKAMPRRQTPRQGATGRPRPERRSTTFSRCRSLQLVRPTSAPRSAEFLPLPVAAGRQSPWIELALADGTVLRLPSQNVAALLAVVRVLRGEPVDLVQGAHRDA